jgi:ribonuclease HI
MIFEVYTDGSTKNNGYENSVGGWAYSVSEDGRRITCDSGAELNTTNQRMELTAAIKALEYVMYEFAVPNIDKVIIYTDSAYLHNCYTQKWYVNWKKNGWKTAKKEPVKNQDLWMQLDELVNKHHCKFSWVKGHSDNELNNRCDDLLNKAMDNFDVNSINDVVVIEKDIDILKQLIKMRDELNDLISRLTT